MRVALFADIHANQHAFSACLSQARNHGADQIVLLGDYVGYGADPSWVVSTVMELVEQGAAAVLGNHDNAVGGTPTHLNAEAQVAIEWTRGELDRGQRQFLAGLPLTLTEEERLYVHSEASRPGRWNYVQNVEDAARSIRATSAQVTFCGHTHRPALYSMSPIGKMTSFTPVTGVAVPLLPGRRWLAVLGAVGQPRDGSSAASYLFLDTATREMTYCRVPYDVEGAAARIRNRGLPASLSDRLLLGN
jgi:diadenosine tetraphosphatase ApaH/serine/threonine PP2A family protein phosphatase